MIELIIDSSLFEIPQSRSKLDFVRIKCLIGLKKKDGSGYSLAEGIIDTGAYVSVIPKDVGEVIEKEVTGKYRMKGLNSREECAIPVLIGSTTCILFDEQGNTSGDMKISSFFAETNDVPVIIGFADILNRFTLTVDYQNNKAFLK
jgi:hypothetical protein